MCPSNFRSILADYGKRNGGRSHLILIHCGNAVEEAAGVQSQSREHIAAFRCVLATGFVSHKDSDTTNQTDNGQKEADIINDG